MMKYLVLAGMCAMMLYILCDFADFFIVINPFISKEIAELNVIKGHFYGTGIFHLDFYELDNSSQKYIRLPYVKKMFGDNNPESITVMIFRDGVVRYDKFFSANLGNYYVIFFLLPIYCYVFRQQLFIAKTWQFFCAMLIIIWLELPKIYPVYIKMRSNFFDVDNMWIG